MSGSVGNFIIIINIKNMENIMTFVEEKALKLKNPDLYKLYKTGLADKCGNLTGEGELLKSKLLEEIVYDKMVAVADEKLAEDKAEKKK